MTATTTGDESDFPLHGRIGTVHISGLKVGSQPVGVRKGKALELLTYHIFGILNELLYGLAP